LHRAACASRISPPPPPAQCSDSAALFTEVIAPYGLVRTVALYFAIMNKLLHLGSRPLAFAGAVACFGLIGIAIYLQNVVGLEPCPLCMLQRLVYVGLGTIFLIQAIHGPGRTGTLVYGVLELAAALTGAGFSARHVWLQWNPPDFNACTADLFFQLRKFPVLNVIERALRATGDCAVVDWTMLGLSIAEWSLVWFGIFALAALAVALRAGTLFPGMRHG